MLSEILQEQLNKSCNCRVKENDTNSLKLKSESTSQGIDRMNEFVNLKQNSGFIKLAQFISVSQVLICAVNFRHLEYKLLPNQYIVTKLVSSSTSVSRKELTWKKRKDLFLNYDSSIISDSDIRYCHFVNQESQDSYYTWCIYHNYYCSVRCHRLPVET